MSNGCTATKSFGNQGSPKPFGPSLILTDAEATRLAQLARSVASDPSAAPVVFCREVKQAARKLPVRVLKAVEYFARHGSDAGILVVSNVPTGKVPPTPNDNTCHVGETTLMARCQALLNCALGHMLGYEAEGYGRLYQDMVPKRAAERTQTSLGFGVELELHTEQAFSDLKPDWVSLACLRGNAKAKTYVFTARDLVRALSADELDALRQPLWETSVDDSFRLGGYEFVDGDVRGPMPILSGDVIDPMIILDQDLMVGITDLASTLLDKVLALYQTHRREHVLQPGEVLLLDNRRAVHGRSPFQPRWDGEDRFIVRSFVVRRRQPFDGKVLNDTYTVAARFS